MVLKTFLLTLCLVCTQLFATVPQEIDGNVCVGNSCPSLEQMVGQMIIVGFRGKNVDENSRIVQQIKQGEVGGVILYDWDQINKDYDRNIESPSQLKKLCQKLQAHAAQKLFISIDQEGGLVNRLKPIYGFSDTLSAAELSKMPLFSTFRESAKIASMLSQAGINVNFAPVADLNINLFNPSVNLKGRSFGVESTTVVDHILLYWLGHREHQVMTTLKHFPGIGSADKNTHLEFVDVTDSWNTRELEPFKWLLPYYDCLIMTGHIYNRNLDSDYPASLSRRVVQGILRDGMGFDGVVITDDLQMGAIRDYYTLKESIKLAILSGTDILLFANNEIYDGEIASKVVSLITAMVELEEIPESRIKESYNRIQKLKKRL